MTECEKCNGTGKIRYEVPPSGDEVRLGDGTVIADGGGHGTRPCSCVRDLPEVNERATWWDSETVWARVHEIPVHNERAEISVSAEVPRTEGGRRAVRRGNRYYPSLIDVQAPESMTLLADDARDLALALLAAAEAADEIDVPCWDEDGFWAHVDWRTDPPPTQPSGGK